MKDIPGFWFHVWLEFLKNGWEIYKDDNGDLYGLSIAVSTSIRESQDNLIKLLIASMPYQKTKVGNDQTFSL